MISRFGRGGWFLEVARATAARLDLRPGPIPGDPDLYHEGIVNVSTL